MEETKTIRPGRITPGSAAVVIVCALALLGPMQPSPDTDTWWHLATGDLIIENGALPDSDPFSWSAAGKPWVLQAWGSEVIFAAVHDAAGAAGLLVLQGILIGATATLVALTLRRFAADDLVVAGVLLATVFAGTLIWTVRPHLFTVVLFATYLRILAVPTTPLSIWWLVPLTVVWANLHGGFVVGLVLIGIFATVRSITGDGHLLWRVLGACVIVGGINPAGPALYLHPLRVMAASTEVIEWQPPSLRSPAALTFAIMALGTLGLLAWRRRRPPPALLLTAVVMALAGFAAVRNVPLGAIALAPCLAYGLDGLIPTRPPARPAVERDVLVAATVALVVVGALVAISNLGAGESRLLGGSKFPAAAVAELNELPPGRLANPYNWGGYLIYHAPGFPVSFDGRNDMYGRELLDRQLLLEDLKPGWREFLDGEGVRYVLWMRTKPLAEALRLDEGWHLLHEDRVAVLFERA